ncbi:conserved protein of unknown function [Microbacterium sp. Nx66]|uniref:glyoxalase n=1 Tax=Microbacterium sp. Nx66 TaxID=2766784 RepID=UPI0016571F47|nr:glyoxalase [Microbacterium sp. Nx66]CAD5140715.1 conserved protein of unknown function [Microbacterium sp. Nx66]
MTTADSITLPVNELAVPMLPSDDAERTVEFYTDLGFLLLHRQAKPYPYLALSWRNLDVHFTRRPEGADPDREDFACLVAVDDVVPYHAHFAAALKRVLGRVPAMGRPRITRLRPGASRFTLVDPDGNNIIFVQRGEPRALEYGGSPDLVGLAKALDSARILRDFREDARAAFRALDSALRRPKSSDTDADTVTALMWMLELAEAAGAAERRPELVRSLLDRGVDQTTINGISGVS